jgi:hypothetical protein
VRGFFATLEYEPTDRHPFATKAEAQTAVFRFVEGSSDPSRRHSSIGHLPPAEFEAARRSDRTPNKHIQTETCP